MSYTCNLKDKKADNFYKKREVKFQFNCFFHHPQLNTIIHTQKFYNSFILQKFFKNFKKNIPYFSPLIKKNIKKKGPIFNFPFFHFIPTWTLPHPHKLFQSLGLLIFLILWKCFQNTSLLEKIRICCWFSQ